MKFEQPKMKSLDNKKLDKDKRITAHLIPYKLNNGLFSFFLQKRSDNAERNPGWFTIFGGGIEGKESPEQVMLREMMEELNFTPHNYFYLDKYSDDYSVSYYYAVEVRDNFETNIKISEGDYGKFFSEDEVKNEIKLSEGNKGILKDLINKIQK